MTYKLRGKYLLLYLFITNVLFHSWCMTSLVGGACRTGTLLGKLSSKGAFIFYLSMLYLTFSMNKSSHPHLMLKTCLLLPSRSTAPTEFHLWFIVRRFRERCNYFLSPSPRSKQACVITGSRSSLKMLHVYQFSLCVGGTETGPPQLLCDQGPSLTCTPWLHLLLLFAFHFSSRIYSMSLSSVFTKGPEAFIFVWSYFSLFIRMEWMG